MTDPETKTGPALCLDCVTAFENVDRCPSCASPRLVRHPELNDLAIAHVDCDAFYAAIEKRDNPELKNKPVIVGGGRRGVVSTACYIARIRGVGSAMPMFKALKACPDAVVVRPDMEKYVRVGREVRALMQSLTPLVEPISIDEAFLDLRGTERLHGHGPAHVLAQFAARVEDEIGITVSIGLSHNKFLAKLASDLDKPRGFQVIGREETLSFLAELPVSRIWGVGKALQRKLERDGITRVGQLQKQDEADLMARYGSIGSRLARLSRGKDQRKVSTNRRAKSISSETTFNTDITDYDALARRLWLLSEKVAYRAKRAGLSGRTVTLKLKAANFRIRTRNARLEEPTQLADRLFEASSRLLAKETGETAFRLIGVGLSDLCPDELADPASLIDPERSKRAEAERAVDAVREKFGRDAVRKGRALDIGLARPQRERKP